MEELLLEDEYNGWTHTWWKIIVYKCKLEVSRCLESWGWALYTWEDSYKYQLKILGTCVFLLTQCECFSWCPNKSIWCSTPTVSWTSHLFISTQSWTPYGRPLHKLKCFGNYCIDRPSIYEGMYLTHKRFCLHLML